MPITKELVQSVRERVAANPAVPFALLAGELRASEAEVITALPLNMRIRAKNSDFAVIWQALSALPGVNLCLTAPGRVLNQSAPLPAGGQVGSRFVFFDQTSILGGFLDLENLGYIWFVSRTEQNIPSFSVQFYDKEGAQLFSVFLKQDEQGGIRPEEKELFENMRKEFGVIPKPHNRCKGCTNCTCNGKGGGHHHHHHH
ncbi:hypothetical protein LJC36_05650 [Desulfovibrio sp. OttesenSCG-928-C14]|nr:hypothetical protein [Desulfovibrio sp. OttesenSCG-928-C14]